MPKKRRTPKQRAASRRNLKIARAKRERLKPTGKTKLLFHRTSPQNAESIMKHGFGGAKALRSNLTRSKKDSRSFFSDSPSGEAARYGKALVSVKVSRKLVKRDTNYDTYKGETFYSVANSSLKGKKVKRVL